MITCGERLETLLPNSSEDITALPHNPDVVPTPDPTEGIAAPPLLRPLPPSLLLLLCLHFPLPHVDIMTSPGLSSCHELHLSSHLMVSNAANTTWP
ncbi:uncharacterized [Tachysurus ichikawai]